MVNIHLPPSGPGAALSPEKREKGTNDALFEGVASAVGVSVALGGFNKLANSRFPSYAAMPSTPLRVFSAIAVTAAFAYTAGLSQARHSIQVNVDYASALQARDDARNNARETRA